MSDAQNLIKIIPGPPPMLAPAAPDSLPNEEVVLGRVEEHFGWPKPAQKPVKYLADQLAVVKTQIVTIVQSVADTAVAHMKLDEVTVGLAVSIEGDIGIASAGAEATIELTFKIV